MTYVTGILRIFLLFVFFLFALKNYELATLRFYFDLEWRAPLILMLLVFFVLGVVLTLLALLPRLLRRRADPGAVPPVKTGSRPAQVEAFAPPRDALP